MAYDLPHRDEPLATVKRGANLAVILGALGNDLLTEVKPWLEANEHLIFSCITSYYTFLDRSISPEKGRQVFSVFMTWCSAQRSDAVQEKASLLTPEQSSLGKHQFPSSFDEVGVYLFTNVIVTLTLTQATKPTTQKCRYCLCDTGVRANSPSSSETELDVCIECHTYNVSGQTYLSTEYSS